MPKVTTKDLKNYIKWGSSEHMALLGLRQVDKDEETTLNYKGFTLVNPPVNKQMWIMQSVLRDKVTRFLSKLVDPQSDDPNKAGYAPPMIIPKRHLQNIR